MKLEDLKVKYEKALEKVEKTKKTIERHKNQAQKKLKKIHENGWDATDRYKYANYNDTRNSEAYWLICEYQDKLEDIKNSEKKLKDNIRIADGWKEKLKDEQKRVNTYETELPEIFKTLKETYVKKWDEFDIKRRDLLIEKYNQMEYKEFIDKYDYSGYEFRKKTNEEIHKTNDKEATWWILDLYNRVKAITGDVTDWKHLTTGYKGELNGTVKGKLGTAKVESYLAGGWNIQRLHARILVTELK